MLAPLVVFVVVLSVMYGAFYVAVLRPEEDARQHIRKRLAGGRATIRGKTASFLRSDREITSFPLLDRLLAPWHSVTAPLARSLQEADQKMTVGALLLLCLLGSVVGYAVTYAVFASQIIALLVALTIFWIPIVLVRFMASQRVRKFEEQFPEAIDMISRAMRAGHAFTTALSMAALEGPQPVAGEFKRLYEAQNFGMPLPDALRGFAERIPVLDAKFFVTAVLTQRESGGNLSEILDNLGRVIRERFKVKRQIRVISAHGRMTAGVLMSLPPFLALAFMVINPDHLRSLTGDPLGWWMIGGGATLQLIGCVIIRKLVNIEY